MGPADASWLLRLVQPKTAFDSRARAGENFVGALLVAFETCKRECAEQLSKRGADIGHGFGDADTIRSLGANCLGGSLQHFLACALFVFGAVTHDVSPLAFFV